MLTRTLPAMAVPQRAPAGPTPLAQLRAHVEAIEGLTERIERLAGGLGAGDGDGGGAAAAAAETAAASDSLEQLVDDAAAEAKAAILLVRWLHTGLAGWRCGGGCLHLPECPVLAVSHTPPALAPPLAAAGARAVYRQG